MQNERSLIDYLTKVDALLFDEGARSFLVIGFVDSDRPILSLHHCNFPPFLYVTLMIIVIVHYYFDSLTIRSLYSYAR